MIKNFKPKNIFQNLKILKNTGFPGPWATVVKFVAGLYVGILCNGPLWTHIWALRRFRKLYVNFP